jgi:hypothetical protein
MARPLQELDHYHLPARLKVKKVPAGGFSCRLALADRLAHLHGIHAVEDPSDTLPCRADVFLRVPSRSIRRDDDVFLLCTIHRDDIGVYGLTEWDRHQVLRGGWGRLVHDHVLMHMPRDSEELEVCWGILQRAYQYLSDNSAQDRTVRKASPRDLPRFSRTTLQ